MQTEPQNGWEVMEKAVELSQAGERFALATVVWRQGPSSGKSGSRAVVTSSGETFGWIGGACAEPVLIRESLSALEDGEPRLLLLGMDDVLDEVPHGMVSVPIACQSDGALQVHIEPVLPSPTVAVVGRSPMARTLIDLVETIGWSGLISDSSLPDSIPAGAAIVVATQGHGDEEILLEAARAEPDYLGVVASAKRGEILTGYLRDQGIDEGQLSAIKVPAGLDLGSTSHTEMAVSIIAELVQARARGEFGSGASVSPEARPRTVIDPVCGMEVAVDDSNWPFEYQGVTYYFCNPGCRKSFESDPESYLRRSHAHH